IWSAGFEPTRTNPDFYETALSPDRVEIRRRDGDVETALEVVVSPESPAEVRRVTVTNHGTTRRELEITTYTEVVLSSRVAARPPRALGNLFVETEVLPDRGALLARRRPRGAKESEAFMAQVLTPEEGNWGELEYECSRARFVGRGRGLERPVAMDRGAR